MFIEIPRPDGRRLFVNLDAVTFIAKESYPRAQEYYKHLNIKDAIVFHFTNDLRLEFPDDEKTNSILNHILGLK